MSTHALRRVRGRRLAAVASGVVLALAGGGSALATIPDGGTINACYAKGTGALRVIDSSSEQCKAPRARCPGTRRPAGAYGSRRPAGNEGRSG